MVEAGHNAIGRGLSTAIVDERLRRQNHLFAWDRFDGFADVGFEDVQEPVLYGSNVETALAIVRSMRFVTDGLATLNAAAADAVLASLRSALAAHLTDRGVEFDSRAWLVTARRVSTQP